MHAADLEHRRGGAAVICACAAWRVSRGEHRASRVNVQAVHAGLRAMWACQNSHLVKKMTKFVTVQKFAR